MCASRFDYNSFSSLYDDDLRSYIEPLIASDNVLTFEEGVIDRLQSELEEYDEYHLVYALLLMCRHSTELAVSILPDYLGHRWDSVYCTVVNLISTLPDDAMTDSFLDAVRVVCDKHPERPYLKNDVRRWERRIKRR